jgi:glycine/D-amino acid oxidase-like deaminating enzyme
MLSFWERNSFTRYNYIIAGGGILGLSVACELKERFPDAEVLILERGIFPTGASTRNAGFLCYGSYTEILSDIRNSGEDAAVTLVEKRWKGMNKLISRLNGVDIGYINCGEYELIDDTYINLLDKLPYLNRFLKDIFNDDNVFVEDKSAVSRFGFNSNLIRTIVYSPYESQIDTGRLMKAMFKYANSLGIIYLTGAEVREFSGNSENVKVYLNHNILNEKINLMSDYFILCTNAFIHELMPETDVKPARGTVIVTKPVSGLKLQGIYHYDEGYYYFRNYQDRVILGGARNMDFKTEETTEFSVNNRIYSKLKEMLDAVILPDINYEIDYCWTGIMGFSGNKQPFVSKISDRIISALSCNGMGIALSSVVAEEVVSSLTN